MKAKLAIIGGGVSGIALALSLQEKYDITIFEREKELLLKLLKTGNGKANIYNRGINASHYNDENFMRLHAPQIEKTLDDFFAKLGILTFTDEASRVYPYSRSAAALRKNLINRLNVKINVNANIKDVLSVKDGYLINDESFTHVILATGSSSGLFKRSLQNDNENLLNSLRLPTTPLTPVIKTIKVHENLAALKHERVDAVLSLYADGEKIVSERGEILFKSDGLSGIVSFVISSYFEWAANAKKKLSVAIDFMPDHSVEEVAKIIKNKDDLSRVFSSSVASFLSSQKTAKLPALIKHFPLVPESGNYPENAQAMHGGVGLFNISEYFNLKNEPTLFVLGEVLNIDGICGGYNLGFAFYSGIKASKYFLNNLSI